MKNNRFRRFTAAAAAVLLMSAAPMNMYASSAGRSDPGMISLHTFNENDMSQIINVIAQGIFDHQAEIDVSYFDCRQEYALEIVSTLLVKYPDIFFLDRKVPASFTLSQGKLLRITPAYSFSKAVTDKKLTQFYAEADKYLSLVNNRMSNLEKALVLHDAIIDDCNYILDEDNGSDYELLVKKRGICENYSRVYAYLLGQLGIRTEIIESDKMNHEWLKVNIGGVYYHVDITWDDPLPERSGRVSHRFFLLSDEKISDETYYEPHEDFNSMNNSWSHTYDGNVMLNITSKCCPVNGNIYCIYSGSSGWQLGTISFKEGYNTAVLSFAPVTDLNKLRWPSVNGRFWIGNFSALLEYGGKLYYNSANEIFCYDPKTRTTETVFTLKGDKRSIYGLKIKKGRLYGIMANSPTEKGSEKELMRLNRSGFETFGKRLAKLSERRYTVKKASIPAKLFDSLYEKTGISKKNK